MSNIANFENNLKLMKLTAKAENSLARRTWLGTPPANPKKPRISKIPPKAAMIEELMQEGFTRQEVAQRMSMRYESISGYVNRYNLKA